MQCKKLNNTKLDSKLHLEDNIQINKKYISVTELSLLLGVHRQTILLWLTKKKLNGIRFNHKWYIPLSEVERIISYAIDNK